MNMNMKKEIVICRHCKGSGKEGPIRLASPDSRSCGACSGNGRREKTTNIDYKPFSQKDIKIMAVYEIQSCTQCDSKGHTEHKELEDYHLGTYKYWDETCLRCLGTGRVFKVVNITYLPYKPRTFGKS